MITRKQLKLFAVIIFVHISLLDLMMINRRGLHVLWQDNMQWFTLVVHAGVVLLTCLLLWALHKLKRSEVLL